MLQVTEEASFNLKEAMKMLQELDSSDVFGQQVRSIKAFIWWSVEQHGTHPINVLLQAEHRFSYCSLVLDVYAGIRHSDLIPSSFANQNQETRRKVCGKKAMSRVDRALRQLASHNSHVSIMRDHYPACESFRVQD